MPKAQSLFIRAQHRIATLIEVFGQTLVPAIRFLIKRIPLIIKTIGTLYNVAIQGAPLQRLQATKMTTPSRPAIKPNRQAVEKPRTLEIISISILFGLFTLCAIMIARLFVQVADLKVELNHRDQLIMSRLDDIQKIAHERIIKEAAMPEPKPRQALMTLTDDDIKLIRQFIRILPPKPGAKQTVHLGEKASKIVSVPIPEPLVDQIPKLRGATFSLDQNGAIIIIGAGSNHVDAIIEPNN